MKHELFASIVELNSGVCESPDEALDVLRSLRRATAEAAREVGCTIAAAGSHPTDIASDQEIADEEHYRGFVEYAGPTARRQGVQGVHVHVGMPDAETCLRVMELLIPWLPVVLALSANSPWFEGERTGLMSTRAEILGLLPRRGSHPEAGARGDPERDAHETYRHRLRRHLEPTRRAPSRPMSPSSPRRCCRRRRTAWRRSSATSTGWGAGAAPGGWRGRPTGCWAGFSARG